MPLLPETIGQGRIFLACIATGALLGVLWQLLCLARFLLKMFVASIDKPKKGKGKDIVSGENPSAKIFVQKNRRMGFLRFSKKRERNARRQNKKKKGAKVNAHKKKLFIKNLTERVKKSKLAKMPSFLAKAVADLLFFGVVALAVIISADKSASGAVYWYSVTGYILGFAAVALFVKSGFLMAFSFPHRKKMKSEKR